MSAEIAAERERMTSTEIMAVTGYKLRTIQEMAETGRIDWAYQPNGPGSRWFYDRAAFLKWWSSNSSKGREPRPKKRDHEKRASTGAMGGRTGRSNAAADRAVDPLIEKIRQLRKSMASGPKNSTPSEKV